MPISKHDLFWMAVMLGETFFLCEGSFLDLVYTECWLLIKPLQWAAGVVST